MKNYYKIIRGYGSEDYIQITSDELEKAYYAFLAKKDSIYSGGAVRGSEIIAIQPDYHRAMGWNRGWKLTSDDFDELKYSGVERRHQNLLDTTKEKVQYLIETKQENLIGKNANIELPKPSERSGEVKSIKELTN